MKEGRISIVNELNESMKTYIKENIKNNYQITKFLEDVVKQVLGVFGCCSTFKPIAVQQVT